LINIVNTVPTILLGLIIIGGAVLIAAAIVVFVRRKMPHLQGSAHDVIYLELVGVVYAVLLVFVVIAVWDQYEDARKTSEQEGAMLDSMWHIALSYPKGVGIPMVDAIAAYADSVVHDEWKSLAVGEESPKTTAAMQVLRDTHLLPELPNTTRNTNLYFHSVDLVENVTERRLMRTIQSTTAVPGAVWVVLLIGAFALVGLSVLVSEKSTKVHVVMTSTLAGVIAATLFVILILDYPWAGDMAIQPESFEHIHSMQVKMHPELSAPS
jgi:hypothetical protein